VTTATHDVPRAPAADDESAVREYVHVWDRVVRSTHWLIFLSIVVLSVTGIYIGHPFLIVAGRARDHFVMGTMKVVHFYTAIVFTLAVLSRILWMFIGPHPARWDQFIPVAKARRQAFVDTLKYYFWMRPRAPVVSGHNPLAGLAYAGVFLLYLVMIATGFGLYSLNAAYSSPMIYFHFLLAVFGGAQMSRWIHHAVMWLLIAFFVHHLYSAILFSAVEKAGAIESIFSGNKWLPRGLMNREKRAAHRARERERHE
jgi:Ni/Fe-hydrogenase 1 B-type cytochrome subunit